MKSKLLAFGAGLVFGLGLLLSGMTQPGKVVAFLDVLGEWDPSLAFVMGGAIAVHALAYRLVPRLPKPVWGRAWAIPSRRDIDARLLVGAVLFGAGWGLGGYCPGPALTSVVTGASTTLLFTGAMLAGMWGWSLWETARSTRLALDRSVAPGPPAADKSQAPLESP